ncbi:MAG: hypothetical protein GC201_17570 [Alphaproteobacteria bacterium]|nr:hypothetical protein [Alphaproteobacteria bacterium]
MIRRLAVACLVAGLVPFCAQAAAPATDGAATPAAQAPAGAPAQAKFLVLDMDRVAAESAAMKSIYRQMTERRDKEATAYNAALDKLEKDFEPVRAAASDMDADQYQYAKDQFDAAKAHMDDVLDAAQQRMNKAASEALDKVNAVATEIGQDLLKEYGAERMVDATAVLYMRDGAPYDVTDQVIARLDRQLPDIKVNFPEPPKNPGDAEAAKPAKATKANTPAKTDKQKP